LSNTSHCPPIILSTNRTVHPSYYIIHSIILARFPTLPSHNPPTSSHFPHELWRWKQHVPAKRWCATRRVGGVAARESPTVYRARLCCRAALVPVRLCHPAAHVFAIATRVVNTFSLVSVMAIY
jgi:hypothetical protein